MLKIKGIRRLLLEAGAREFEMTRRILARLPAVPVEVIPDREALRAPAGDRAAWLTRAKETVVLAGQRVVNKVLICASIGLHNSHFWRQGQDTTAINRFHLADGVWHIISLNDACHRRGMARGPYVDF